MKAEARHGNVVIDGVSMSRDRAIEALLEIARAVQMAGDISDPFAAQLVDLLSAEVK